MRNPLLICVCLLSFLMFPAGMAEAVTLNPRGLGQVLIFPYYTVNAGQDTLISVTNTGNRGKAVRLRFLEGYNNQDVIDFDLFLSPKDVWTGAITADAAGGARLISQDHSCTLPALPAAGIAFSAPAAGNDNGWPSGMERTREGSIQISRSVTSFPAARPTLALPTRIMANRTTVLRRAVARSPRRTSRPTLARPVTSCSVPVRSSTWAPVPTIPTTPTRWPVSHRRCCMRRP